MSDSLLSSPKTSSYLFVAIVMFVFTISLYSKLSTRKLFEGGELSSKHTGVGGIPNRFGTSLSSTKCKLINSVLSLPTLAFQSPVRIIISFLSVFASTSSISNLAEIIRELIWLYPISILFAPVSGLHGGVISKLNRTKMLIYSTTGFFSSKNVRIRRIQLKCLSSRETLSSF